MKRIFMLMLFIVFGLFLIAGIFPILYLFILSFSGGWSWPDILPAEFSLRAWKYVLGTASGTWHSIGVSLYIAVVVTIINAVIAIPAGDALGRYNFPFKGVLEIILMLPILVPPIVILVGLHRTFISLGLTEKVSGVILAHMLPTLPYMIRATTISFSRLGFEWEEQAKILGAGMIRRFVHVVFPFLLPGIIVGSALTILISMSQYVITLLIGGGQVITLTVKMFPYLNGGDQGTGAAYSILFALVATGLMVLLDVFLNRLYIEKRM